MRSRPDITSINLARAEAFCIAAHSAIGQTRKYTGEPYWLHPLGVAALIQEHIPDAPEEVLIAAMLHDVKDDTKVSLDLIREVFQAAVAELVDALSDDTTPADGPRRVRKAMEREKIARASHWAKTLRLADVIKNIESIAEFDPQFAKVYMAEKRDLLPNLRDGNPRLFAIASSLVNAYFEAAD
jgi:(p)ppGpp synthase/HD superfamily hydrolase